MKLSLLMAFLRSGERASALTTQIAPEVQAVVERSRTRGTSLPIIVDRDMPDLPQVVGFPEVRRLCAAYLGGDLDSDELAYISDALQLLQLADCVEYADPRIFDMLFIMSDPEVNDPFEQEDAREMLAEIDRASDPSVERPPFAS